MPPKAKPSNGTTDWNMVMVDICRPASARWKLSLMITRPIAMHVAAPSPWNIRMATSISMLVENRAPRPLSTNSNDP